MKSDAPPYFQFYKASEITDEGRIDSAENVARSRLRVNTRKWLLSKTLPKARKGADAIDEGQARVYGNSGVGSVRCSQFTLLGLSAVIPVVPKNHIRT